MSLAGHPVVVYAKATNAAVVAADEVDGLNSVGYSPKMNMLDVTDFKDTSGFTLKLAGLGDGAVSLAGDLEPADAPQALLRSSFLTGASVWMTLHFNPTGGAGTRGFAVECKVESFEIKAEVAGKVTFSASLTFNGAPAAS